MGITGKTEQKTKKRQVEIYGNIFFNLLLWLISMSFRVLIKAKVFWQKYCCWALWIFWYSMMKIINIGTDSLFKIVDGICKLFCNIKLVFFLHRRYRYIASKVCAIEIWGTLQKYQSTNTIMCCDRNPWEVFSWSRRIIWRVPLYWWNSLMMSDASFRRFFSLFILVETRWMT